MDEDNLDLSLFECDECGEDLDECDCDLIEDDEDLEDEEGEDWEE